MSNLRTLFLSGGVALAAMLAQPGAATADVKNIVLVHGANIDGSTWRKVYDRLTAQDFNVTIAQLPLTSVEDDIAAVQRNLDSQDGPVLLVGHSYGGLIISEAGADPDVKGLVYVAAFQPEAGESIGALSASAPTDLSSDMLQVFNDDYYLVEEKAWVDFVANGLPEADALFSARSQAASNTSIFKFKAEVAAWNAKPSWTAIAIKDRTIAPALQHRMAERAGSTVIEIENGHMLPMTSPEEIAGLIREAAEAVD